jgi:tetratricopeptide (TPR) repeat protein
MRSVAACVCFCIASPLLAQSPEDIEKAAKIFQEAEGHYSLLEYQQALDKYKESYRLSNEPALLYNIAQCYRLLNRNEESIQSYKNFLRLAAASPEQQEVARKFIAELEAKLAQPATTAATQPVPKDEPKPEKPKNIPAFAALGGAGALGVGAVVTGLLGIGAGIKLQTLQAADDSDPDEIIDTFKQMRALGVTAGVLGGLAVGAGIGGVVLLQTNKKETTVSLSIHW